MSNDYEIHIDLSSGDDFTSCSIIEPYMLSALHELNDARQWVTAMERKEDMIDQINRYYRDMEKKQPKRDNKGRFVKNEPKKAKKKDNQEAYVYALTEAEYTKLVKERDTYKELAERLGSDYLNKCAEYGELKRELTPYKENWAKLKKIAKHWKRVAKKHLDVLEIATDALRECVYEVEWYQSKMPWYKRLLYKKAIKVREDKVFDLVMRVERLTEE